jgi:hypothetical protein
MVRCLFEARTTPGVNSLISNPLDNRLTTIDYTGRCDLWFTPAQQVRWNAAATRLAGQLGKTATRLFGGQDLQRDPQSIGTFISPWAPVPTTSVVGE